MDHFFIHSSGDGDLGCFHILAIGSNAAVSVWEGMPSWIGVLGCFGERAGVGLLGPSLSLVVAFALKSVQSGVSIATPAFLISTLMKHLFLSLCFQPVCLWMWREPLVGSKLRVVFSYLLSYPVLFDRVVIRLHSQSLLIGSYFHFIMYIFSSFFLLKGPFNISYNTGLVVITPLGFSRLGSSLSVHSKW